MNLQQAIEVVEHALENPVSTWLDNTLKDVTLVLYDEGDLPLLTTQTRQQ